MIWESLVSFEHSKSMSSEEVLKSLLLKSGFNEELDEFKKTEKIFPFGIGKGVVLYKKRVKDKIPELYIEISDSPVEYDSFDGVPISIFCFLVITEKDEPYLEYLSRLYRLLNFETLRERLCNAKSIEEVRKVIKREERGLRG